MSEERQVHVSGDPGARVGCAKTYGLLAGLAFFGGWWWASPSLTVLGLFFVGLGLNMLVLARMSWGSQRVHRHVCPKCATKVLYQRTYGSGPGQVRWDGFRWFCPQCKEAVTPEGLRLHRLFDEERKGLNRYDDKVRLREAAFAEPELSSDGFWRMSSVAGQWEVLYHPDRRIYRLLRSGAESRDYPDLQKLVDGWERASNSADPPIP